MIMMPSLILVCVLMFIQTALQANVSEVTLKRLVTDEQSNANRHHVGTHVDPCSDLACADGIQYVCPRGNGHDGTMVSVSRTSIKFFDSTYLSNDFPTIESVSQTTDWAWGTLPQVVAVMPSKQRHFYLAKSLEYLSRQHYTNIYAVVIVDEDYVSIEEDETSMNGIGSDSTIYVVKDLYKTNLQLLQSRGVKVFYSWLDMKADNFQSPNIGKKRNMVAHVVKQKVDPLIQDKDYIIIHWDDDDFYSPSRVLKQAYPLIAGVATISALSFRNYLKIDENAGAFYPQYSYFAKEDGIHQKWIACGTLTYWASTMKEIEYPEVGCGEDVGFLRKHLNDGLNQVRRLQVLDETEVTQLYTRHGSNTWKGGPINLGRWRDIPMDYLRSRGFARHDQDFYNAVANAAMTESAIATRKLLSIEQGTDTCKCMEKDINGMEHVMNVQINEIRGRP